MVVRDVGGVLGAERRGTGVEEFRGLRLRWSVGGFRGLRAVGRTRRKRVERRRECHRSCIVYSTGRQRE